MRIFITGGTGSLGVALVKKFTELHHDCTIYSRDEVKQSELKVRFPQHRYILGDVRELPWMQLSMREHDVVIHAAAYKQVPAAEANASEAIETNVIGSRNVAMAAVAANVPLVVGISTDKACAPINCYGQTKALMERIFQQASGWSDTRFALVRYGNVLGSRGSVVPLFRRQLANDGIVTITDPRMTRFWLTLNDAVNLVIAAMNVEYDAYTTGGIRVPKAGASTMAVLARAVAQAYGFDKFDPKQHIHYIGIRAGEKMHESLVSKDEAQHSADYDRYFMVRPAGYRVSMPLSLTAGPDFEYTSASAHQLTVDELAGMLCQD